ncbi:MAG: hypothetical protein FWG92_08170 [Leptospirales bacterium]|nr:hypothetical protein [Leptospirales bacterium]
MKNIFFLLCFVPALMSCSGFSVKKVVSQKNALSALKSSGVIVRVWKNSVLPVSDIESNIRYWFDESRKNNSLPFLPAGPLSYYADADRFCQLSEGKFLEHKSSGAVRVFLSDYREELSDLMKDNNLDSLIFYEVDGFFSPEFQLADVKSVIVIVDQALNVLYMDYYSKDVELEEWDRDVIKKIVLDQISRRFVHSMQSLGYIKK